MSALWQPFELVRALRALPPRQERLLAMRLLEKASDAACAAHYGITQEAFGLHLLRALDALADALAGRISRPGQATQAQDLEWSAALNRALLHAETTSSSGGTPSNPDVARVHVATDDDDAPAALRTRIALALQLREHGSALRAGLEAAERADADSPKRRRVEALRLAAIVALLALALWFGLR